MDDPIEIVARAMYAADGLKHADGSSLEQSWADSPLYHEDYRRRARAALLALRNPTEGMLQAMHEAMFQDAFDGTNAPMLGAGFEAAIDHALQTQGEGE